MFGVTYKVDWSTLHLTFPVENSPVKWPGESFADNDNVADREYTIADIENDGRWVAVLGDIHGNFSALNMTVEACRQANIRHLFQVGDLGYLFDYNEAKRKNKYRSDKNFDELLFEAKEEFGLTFHFVDGNHDNHALFHRDNPDKSARKATTDFDGFRLPSQLIYHPRGSIENFVLEGGFNTEGEVFDDYTANIGFLGGARSVNVLPFEEEKREGWDFWYDEEPTDEDVAYMVERAKEVSNIDVMITHDAPSKHYLKGGMKISNHMEALSARTRNRVAQAVNEIAPDLLVHGHWHQWAQGVYEGHRKRSKLLCLPEEHKWGNLVFINAEDKTVLVPQGTVSRAGDNEDRVRVFG